MLLETPLRAQNEIEPGLIIRHYETGLRTYEVPASVFRSIGSHNLTIALRRWQNGERMRQEAKDRADHIARLLREGVPSAEIAQRVGVTRETVRTHKKRLQHDT